MFTIIGLLIANAIAHIISFVRLNKINSPDKNGVLAFVFINAIVAVLLWQGIDWAKYLALIFPLLGGLGLLFTNILKGKGTWIDYLILALDVALVVLIINYIF